jgi:ammonium transporter, Amt family
MASNSTNSNDTVTKEQIDLKVAQLKQVINLIWNFLTLVVVFSMQLGFIFLEAGASRRKHSRTVLLKNLIDTSTTILCFWLIGFQFTNGLEGGFIGQFSYKPDNYYVKWLISFCFCNTATTIVSGSLAERTFNDTYIFSTVLLSGLVYPLGAGWVWGDGWL